jgi:AcrR family transcriptional regulator
MNHPTTPMARAGTRADAQRDRILCAALSCFVEHGFHAASMGSIAEAASMSPGLIYRYFENKNAIVLAIVERQLEEKRALIRQLQSSDQLVDDLVRAFDEWRTTRSGALSVALSLEMSAEATRNPQIADALRKADMLARAEFREWLCRSRDLGGMGMSTEQAATRALSVRCVVDGLSLRAVREPDLDLDVVRTALNDLLGRLLG